MHKDTINKMTVAMDAMRRPGARLIQTFSYYGKPDYWIAPAGGRVEQKIAEQIIARDRWQGCIISRPSPDLANRN
jgi:hypothetical protein